MLIEVKEGKKVISSREVELKELNLTDRGKFLDLMMDFQINPAKDYFSRIISVCRVCTDYTDEELNKFEDAEFMQLFNIIVTEKNKKKLTKSS